MREIKIAEAVIELSSLLRNCCYVKAITSKNLQDYFVLRTKNCLMWFRKSSPNTLVETQTFVPLQFPEETTRAENDFNND